jgi:hypothetical protein
MRATIMSLATAAVCAVILACAAGCKCPMPAEQETDLSKIDFKKMDVNNKKSINEGEFNAYVIANPQLGLKKTVFQKCDIDHDGNVTCEEFEKVQRIESKGEPAKQ